MKLSDLVVANEVFSLSANYCINGNQSGLATQSVEPVCKCHHSAQHLPAAPIKLLAERKSLTSAQALGCEGSENPQFSMKVGQTNSTAPLY